MSIDARYHAEAMAKRAATIEHGERVTQVRAEIAAKVENRKRILQKIRADFAKPTRTIAIDAPIGTLDGQISARQIKSQLPTDGSPIRVLFHSEGGSVFEAFAIYDALANYPGPKTAVVESMAFSAASLLLCVFDEVEATPNSYVMLHAPHMEDDYELSESDHRLLEQLRERMVGIYAAKTGKPKRFIEKEVEREVFYDAESAIELGIVNRISTRSSLVAARLPVHVLAMIKTGVTLGKPATHQWRAAVDALAKTMPRSKAVLQVERDHPGLRQRMIQEANRR